MFQKIYIYLHNIFKNNKYWHKNIVENQMHSDTLNFSDDESLYLSTGKKL